VRRILFVAFLLTLPLVTPRIRGADEIEGFAYLRSAVFDRDLDFTNEYQAFFERDPRGLAGFAETFLARRDPTTGRAINFAPIGSAVLWSPFYLAAHGGVLICRALGATVAADGFSRPYVAAVCYASALYGFLGLLLIQDTLVRFAGFASASTTATVLCLWFGTPVLYYMTLAPGFSHACSLAAVALLLWLTLRAAAEGRGRPLEWALVGAAGGLAGLVREQDVLFLAVPAGLLSWRILVRREWNAGLPRLLSLVAAALVVFLPQLFVYRVLHGRFGPSRLVSRKMSFSSPHFLDVLFDPGHGLFLWSPVLLLAFVGLVVIVARRDRREIAPFLLLALLLQVWINGAVLSWSQAGAFGSRRFLGATAVFAWGLAAALEDLRRRLGQAAPIALVVLAAWWNASLMVQFGLKIMDRQRLEWPAVAVRQFTEVPPRLARSAWLFLTDRERLLRETR
jgi:hypothetical protein